MPRTRPTIADLRAMKGKMAASALEMMAAIRQYEQLRAVGGEIEVVPVEVAKVTSKHTSLFMLSLKARTDCDAQYLFAEDTLSRNRSRISRHSTGYLNFAANMADCSRSKLLPCQYCEDVGRVTYPEDGHVVNVDPAEIKLILDPCLVPGLTLSRRSLASNLERPPL